jgi:phospholipid/cholesterol/gamma-HCH transport system ATP-binding protein
MNSVIEIGDNILFIHKGENWWTGNKSEILHTTNKELFNFVFAGEFMKSVFKVQNK